MRTRTNQINPDPATGNPAPRRLFLKKALLGAGAVVSPLIIPASVLGRGGGVAPSNRITLGGIGIGPRGKLVLAAMMAEPDVRFIATCDVQARMRDEIKGIADTFYGNRDCATYRDMRELLARRDIDAVLIATGDRWHALGSILAAKAGKDVFSEKPCGVVMGQCQALADTIRRTGRVFQAGTQRRNIPNFQFAVHLARSGRLGRLHTLHASIYVPQVVFDWLPAQPEPPRDVIDWDMWLGPAPWRPYNSAYVVERKWRGYYDFDSGAKILDLGAHTVDLCQWANGADDTTPTEFEPQGNSIQARYANGVNLVMRRTGWIRQPSDTSWGATGGCSVRFEGDEGWVETGDNGTVESHPASLRQEWRAFSMRGTDAANHARDFFDCVKSRGLPAANYGVMRHSHTACYAAAIAWQLGRKLRFDPEQEAFIGDEEANRMRSRALREPWHI